MNTLVILLKSTWLENHFCTRLNSNFTRFNSFLPKITQNSFFFGNSILDSLYTRLMKATRVRVSTSVKKEVLISEYSSEWVLSDHTSRYLLRKCQNARESDNGVKLFLNWYYCFNFYRVSVIHYCYNKISYLGFHWLFNYILRHQHTLLIEKMITLKNVRAWVLIDFK